MPFYVSPEQVMKDKADYARKGIARGRSVVVLASADGILFVAENPSRALHKISEIYDRIAFAAVGKYNEFENLRQAGVRLADMRGYSYDRRDVTGRGLANAYAQTLGTIFTETNKPYEVELVVAELGATQDEDQVYRLTYDGSVADEHGFVAMGGQAEQVAARLGERFREGLDLAGALRLAVEALGAAGDGGAARTLTAAQLEVALLDRSRPRRTFRRLTGAVLERLLGADAPAAQGTAPDDPAARPVPGPTALAGGPFEPAGPDEPGREGGEGGEGGDGAAPTGPTPPPPSR
nr:proteasome subunit alpha [Vallicoccus soli]